MTAGIPYFTTARIELELSPGVWTSVGAYFDENSSLSFSRGVNTDRKPYVGSMSFDLSNASNDLSPGNNASTTFFNKILKGIGVRFYTTAGANTQNWWRGVISDVQAKYDALVDRNRVSITCEGNSSLYRRFKKYSMPLLSSPTIDTALTAIMAAVGSTLYSFPASAFHVPYSYASSDALTDMVTLALSECGGWLYEDGIGRLVTKRYSDMIGGYSAPTWTWGVAPQPVGVVQPDYRNDAQFAGLKLTINNPTLSTPDTVIYQHPYSFRNGICELFPGHTQRRYHAVLDKMPVGQPKPFVQIVATFADSGDDLGAHIEKTSTTLTTLSNAQVPKTFAVNDYLLIDQEIMKVTAVAPPFLATDGTPIPTYSQSLTVTRGIEGTIANVHSPVYPGGLSILVRHGNSVVQPFQFFDSGWKNLDVIPNTFAAYNMRFNLPINSSYTGMQVGFVALTTGTTTFNLNTAFNHATIGQTIRIDNELMTVVNGSDGGLSVPATITVTRAVLGSAVAPHNALSSINYFSPVLPSTMPTVLQMTTNGGTTTEQFGISSFSYTVNTVSFTAIGTFVTTRGYNGTLPAAFAALLPIYANNVSTAPLDDIEPASFVKSSTFASGNPATGNQLSGGTIYVVGRDLWFTISNSFPGGYFLADAQISCQVLDFASAQAVKSFYKAIPNQVGISQGPDLTLPYGAIDQNNADAFAVGQWRSGRASSPWLNLSFTIRDAASASGLISTSIADIGDLVHYIGTDVNREYVDEYLRILAIKGSMKLNEPLTVTYLLGPSHEFRNPTNAYWTDFTWQAQGSTVGLGTYNIKPNSVQGFTNDANWRILGGGVVTLNGVQYPQPYRGSAASIVPGLVPTNLGTADMIVEAQVGGIMGLTGTTGADSNAVKYGATSSFHGTGVAFRCTGGADIFASGGWLAAFNPTAGVIYLWNANDGVVVSKAWTFPALAATDTYAPEISVRATGDATHSRIRVYVDCAGEPIIDTTRDGVSVTVAGRYATNTWFSPYVKRNNTWPGTAGAPAGPSPYFYDLYAQGV